jgi:exosortase/archaeosortase family protein
MADQRVDRSGGKPRWLAHAPSLRFALTFTAIAAALFCLYFFPYAENGGSEAWLSAYLERYTHFVAAVLRVVEPGISVTHTQIQGRFSMTIVRSCDAMEANILFGAAVLALPGAWWRKAVALPVGLFALVAFNVLRLCSLYYIGVYFPSHFEFAHLDLWPLLIIGFAAADFMVCASWLRRAMPPSPVSAEGPTRVAA